MSFINRRVVALSRSELFATDPERAIASLAWFADSVADDRSHNRFNAWGRSTVIDENIGEAVLSRGLFDALHEAAGLECAWPIGNAGLLHCYGYLLSDAATPYGLKRDRWLTPDLARASGKPDDYFEPNAPDTTLLERVAAVMNRAFDDPAADLMRIDAAPHTSEICFIAHRAHAAVAYRVDPKLMTTFPIGASVEATRAVIAAEPPRLRWNAVD